MNSIVVELKCKSIDATSNPPEPVQNSCPKFNFLQTDCDQLRHAFSTILQHIKDHINSEGLTPLYDHFIKRTHEIVASTTPILKIRQSRKNVHYSKSVEHAIHQRQLAYQAHKSHPTPTNEEILDLCTKKAKNAVRANKSEFLNEHVAAELNKGNSKPLYKYLDSCKGSSQNTGGNITADQFRSFFETVFRPEPPGNPTVDKHHCPTQPPLKINWSGNVTPYMVRELASNCDDFVRAMAMLLQESVRTGEIPAAWKEATIVPIYKAGDKSQPSNYRPISLTSCISKTLEHLIVHHIWSHLDCHGLLSNSQHGFRNNLNCTTQLLHTYHKMVSLSTKNPRHDTLAVSLDFAKAFDSVPHRRLSTKLKAFNIDESVLSWTTNWLSDRKFRVRVGSSLSSEGYAESGVPQGSVLGPLLFLLFVDDLRDSILHSDLRLYADDTLLIHSAPPADQWKIQSDLDALSRWSDTWCMKFNLSKCVVLKVELPHQVPKPAPTLQLNNQPLTVTQYMKYLGITFQQDLKFDRHISNTITKANRVLYRLMRCLHYAQPKCKLIAYKTCVQPILEYASPVWSPSRKSQISTLETIQRRAVRFIFRIPKYESLSDTLTKNGIPPLMERRALIDKYTLSRIETRAYNIDIQDYIEVNKAYETRGKTLVTFNKSAIYRESFFPRMRHLVQTV